LSALAGAGLFCAAGTAAASSVSSGPVGYSCSLAAYGQSLAPLSLVIGLSAENTGSAVTVRLTTQPAQLPAATAAALPALSYFNVAGSAPTSMPGARISLAGQSQYLGSAAGGMTQLPAITATGTMQAQTVSAGMANVEVPPTLTLTPVGSTAKAPLTCTTASAATVQVAVTASPANPSGQVGSVVGSAVGAGGTAQSYTCTITVGGAATTASQVPMALAVAQPGTVGSQHTVTLSAPVSALGSTFPGAGTPMSVTGSAALGGTATGAVPMTSLADSGNGMFQLTGHWMPQSPGQARIFAPHQFAAKLRAQTATLVTVTCTATSATTTSTQVMVQVSGGSAAATAAASAAGLASAPAAAPGAPDTGGGGSVRAADELPLAAGGGAAVLAGLGIAGYAIRRRRGAFGHGTR